MEEFEEFNQVFDQIKQSVQNVGNKKTKIACNFNYDKDMKPEEVRKAIKEDIEEFKEEFL